MTSHGPPWQIRKQRVFVRITGRSKSFTRCFIYFHVSSPSAGEQQSGPRHKKRCRCAVRTPAFCKPFSISARLIIIQATGPLYHRVVRHARVGRFSSQREMASLKRSPANPLPMITGMMSHFHRNIPMKAMMVSASAKQSRPR
jgi:hypothetical protein